jgi:hypothetical protein
LKASHPQQTHAVHGAKSQSAHGPPRVNP